MTLSSDDDSEVIDSPANIYVPTKETSYVETFLSGGYRALPLVGDSGSGKSRLLAHLYALVRASTSRVVFLQASRLGGWTLTPAASLESNLRPLLALSQASLPDFAPDPLVVIVDGVNEFQGEGGPIALLEYLVDVIPTLGDSEKLIFSCRSEAWRVFAAAHQRGGRALPSLAFPGGGQPVILSGFVADERPSLYEAYQKRYNLRPESYTDTPASLRELIRQPLFMRLIAETYDNRDGDNKRKVGRDLDYYSIFKNLTSRKYHDVVRVSPANATPSQEQLNECLLEIAAAQAKRLLGAGSTESEWVPAKLLAPASTASNGGASLVARLVEVGLLHRRVVRGGALVPEDSEEYRFFHDRYTEYALSFVYVPLLTPLLSDDLPRCLEKILEILAKAERAPVLQGALFHWLNDIRRTHEGSCATLLSALSQQVDGAARLFSASFVYSTRERLVSSEEWDKLARRIDSADLLVSLTDILCHRVPDLPDGDLRTLIELIAKDHATVRMAADILADQFSRDNTRAVGSHILANIPTLLQIAIGPATIDSIITFINKFALKIALTNIGRPEKLEELREFLLTFESLLRPAVLNRGAFAVGNFAHEVFEKRVEATGIDQWNQAIGSQGNNDFFVPCGPHSVVQRDLLRDLFPYAIALYNDEFEAGWLGIDSEFSRLAVQMMAYRAGSVAGYTASVLLVALAGSLGAQIVSPFVKQLLADGSSAAVFSAMLLCSNVAMTSSEAAPAMLSLIASEIMPAVRATLGRLSHEDGAVFVRTELFTLWLGAARADVVRDWPACERILDGIFESNEIEVLFDGRANLGHALSKACFFPELELGERMACYFAEAARRGKPHGDILFPILAALYSRSPRRAEQFCVREGLPSSHIESARHLVTRDLLRERDESSYQSPWNEVFMRALADPALRPLRFFLLRDLFGGLVQSNSVPEFAMEFRRLVFDCIAAFLFEESDFGDGRLSTEAALASALHSPGKGERWLG